MKVLHFADTHIDMVNIGRHDPESGLPLRVLDFLRSLDEIVDTAIREKVDLVLFAGDAYRDRSPAPTFQREWQKRIQRLSKAGIRTLLLVGNHDISPAAGRASALQEYGTLEVPHVTVLAEPVFLTPQELGLELQVLAMPWVTRSALVASAGISAEDATQELEELQAQLLSRWLEQIDPKVPAILMAHGSVQGARYGQERGVMLGNDVILPGSIVRDPRLDYTALGHIHKAQDLNENAHPPVIYPGSIERVDIAEAEDEKFFVIADVNRGKTQVEWRQLRHVRPMYDLKVTLKSPEKIKEQLLAALPSEKKIEGAIVRLTVEYDRAWETLIDKSQLDQYKEIAFDFRPNWKARSELRLRLPEDETLSDKGPLELLDLFFQVNKTKDAPELLELARKLLEEDEGEQD